MGSVRTPSTSGARKYDGLSPSELKRLKDLEQENSQLKKLVAEDMVLLGHQKEPSDAERVDRT